MEPAGPGVDRRFVEDFLDYWCLLAFSVVTGGKLLHGPSFDAGRLGPFTRGLAGHYRHAGPAARLLAFTPLRNVAGAPAISVPAGATGTGLPIPGGDRWVSIRPQ